jgi:hypothetical protein
MVEQLHLDEFLTGGTFIALIILFSVAFQHWIKARVVDILLSLNEEDSYGAQAVRAA